MPPCIHQDCIRHHLKFRPSVPGCFTRYEKLMQRIWESNFNSTWVVGCIPHPTDFNTGRTGMRLHTPGLRPRCAGCTGMRHAYTRTASRHHWMHWHALAYTRTASAHFLLNFFGCFFCTDMRARRAASDNGCTGMPLHTPGLHPRYAGCTGMRKHTPGLHPATTGCTGMRYAYTSTASPHNAERILFSFLLKQNNEK